MHDTGKKIEYEPLPWYLVNAIVDPDIGVILQYKDLMQPKDQKQDTLGKMVCETIWATCRWIYGEIPKKQQTIFVF